MHTNNRGGPVPLGPQVGMVFLLLWPLVRGMLS